MKPSTFCTLLVISCAVLIVGVACSDQVGKIGHRKQSLDPSSYNFSQSDAESYWEAHASDILANLPTSVQSCLSAKGVSSASSVDVTCASTPVLQIWDKEYTIGTSTFKAVCLWECDISIPSEGYLLERHLQHINKYLKASEVSGGC